MDIFQLLMDLISQEMEIELELLLLTPMKQVHFKNLGMDNPNGSQRYYIGHVRLDRF